MKVIAYIFNILIFVGLSFLLIGAAIIMCRGVFSIDGLMGGALEWVVYTSVWVLVWAIFFNIKLKVR